MTDYLINTDKSYWTGSHDYSTMVFLITTFGNNGSNVSNYYGIRPVITLKANTSYTGTGTLTDPFIVN